MTRLGRGGQRQPLRIMSREQQLAVLDELRAEQQVVRASVQASGGRVVASLSAALNAVLAEVDTDSLPGIAEFAQVAAIRPVVNPRLSLSRTISAVGATTVHAAGLTGEGVRVAVLDSGVDYTHLNLGGPGTPDAYLEAYGSGPGDPRNTRRDGLFPTDKVVGGWDFVGEGWTGEDGTEELAPDEDPIDAQGHGTHVADILAGLSADGQHRGVAPGAKLYAFRTCSATTTACSGLAILMALDAALHPDDPANFAGPIENPVDLINISLGSPYGQMQDDAALIVQAYAEFGITVVCAAGNSADLPYIADSPGIAPGALSVAETTVPGGLVHAVRIYQTSLTPITNLLDTASLDWAPVRGRVRGRVVAVGRGCPGDIYPVGASLVGAIALVDRGECDISEKVDRAARAGAIGVLIANNVPGDPPVFQLGAPENALLVPTLVLTQSDGQYLKALIESSDSPVTSYFSPSIVTRLGRSVVPTSSRGPSYAFQSIKPDLGAPGASVSAIAGSGSGEEAFGGTSGSTPVVAGAAALLLSHFLQVYGGIEPVEVVKSFLMNSAEPAIQWSPTSLPGVLAPASRVGAGEVRIDRAITSQAIAYTIGPSVLGLFEDIQPSLSFGYQGVDRTGFSESKTVVIENWSATERTFGVSVVFRSGDDEASGAVTVTPSASSVIVPGYGRSLLEVTLNVDATRLPEWTLNGGDSGDDGVLLGLLEYDGRLELRDPQATLSLPWHILPRKASDMTAGVETVLLAGQTGALTLRNLAGAGDVGTSEVFRLGGTSEVDYPPASDPDTFGVNQALPDLRAAGLRVVEGRLEVGITTFGEPSHPLYPAGFDIFIDRDDDNNDDLWLFTADAGLLDSETTGRTHVWGVDLSTFYLLDLSGTGQISVPLDSDLNSANVIVRAPLARLGLTPSDRLQWVVLAYDSYFTGLYTDFVGPMVDTLDQPRFILSGPSSVSVPTGGSTDLEVTHSAAGDAGSPSQEGFLLLHRQARPGRWADVVRVE